jgi:molecular chaperone GrpE
MKNNKKDINEDGVVEVNLEDLDTPKVNSGSDIENNETDTEEFVELGDDGEELSKKDIVKKLREKIKTLETEKQNNLDGWMRSQADYKNREIQIEKDRKEWGGYAVKRFTEELLVVMDTYDAARSNRSAWESVDANWRGGIEYIFQTFENKLLEQGFEKFGKEGEDFNPEIHEGLGLVEVTEEKIEDSKKIGREIKVDTIAQVIMSGYKYKGQIFRPAKVKVYTSN